MIGRFINMGVEPYNFVSALELHHGAAPGSRDLRELQEAGHYAPEVLKESGLDPAEWAKVPFYEGAGCLECSGSGYRGRSAITELLDLSDRIREMIINRRPTSEIKRAAKEEGMTFLRESGLRKSSRRPHHSARNQQGDVP